MLPTIETGIAATATLIIGETRGGVMRGWATWNRRAIRTGATVVAVCLFVPGMSAGTDRPWSVGFGVAYTFAYESDYESISEPTSGYGQDRLESGFGANFGVDYRLGSFSTGAEIVYLENDADEYESGDSGNALPTKGRFSHTALMFNGGIHFRPNKRWKPYAGLGVGASSFSINDLSDVDDGFTIDGRDTVLALQGIAGVAYRLNDAVDLRFGYRAFWSDEAEAAGTGQDGGSFTNISGPVLIHSIEAGARFSW